jgi:hypothetical protein
MQYLTLLLFLESANKTITKEAKTEAYTGTSQESICFPPSYEVESARVQVSKNEAIVKREV